MYLSIQDLMLMPFTYSPYTLKHLLNCNYIIQYDNCCFFIFGLNLTPNAELDLVRVESLYNQDSMLKK